MRQKKKLVHEEYQHSNGVVLNTTKTQNFRVFKCTGQVEGLFSFYRRKPQMLVSIPYIKLYHQFYHSHLEQRMEALSLAHMENGLATFPWA